MTLLLVAPSSLVSPLIRLSSYRNKVYLGLVKYQKYKRKSKGGRSYENPVEWYEGEHEAVISQELFDQCQKVRANRRVHRQATPKYNSYLLRNLVYCHECCTNLPNGNIPKQYGKLRPHSRSDGKKLKYYRCRAKDLGYSCSQKGIQAHVIDNQVVNILFNLKPPKKWREGITKAIGELLGEKHLEERLNEIRSIIERMDTRWDLGYFSNEREYFEKRTQLQLELEQLTPVGNDDLETAVDLLENFQSHWKRLSGKPEERHQLIQLIVERIYVLNGEVVAITLKSNYHLVLSHSTMEPTSVEIDPMYTCGSDGDRTRDLRLDRPTC